MRKIKAVLEVSLHDDKTKKKAMSIVGTIEDMAGVESILMDMKGQKITITGSVDIVDVVCKMRKLCHTEIVQLDEVKPATEQKKQAEDQKKKDDHAKVVRDSVTYQYSYGYPPPVPYFQY